MSTTIASTAPNPHRLFPDGNVEARRLNDQHLVVKKAMDGRMILAPLNFSAAPLRILDSGTLDGVWLQDIDADTGGKHEFVGIDVDGRDFPKQTSKNISFRVQDVTKEWPTEDKGSFDLVHQRMVVTPLGPGWHAALDRLIELVRPGGWIQLLEVDARDPASAPDDDSALHDFYDLLYGTFASLQSPLNVLDQIVDLLANAGFENIQNKKFPIRYGKAIDDPELAARSIATIVTSIEGMSQLAKKMPGSAVNTDKVETLVARAKEEMNATNNWIIPGRVIWAQKKAE